MNRYRSGHDPMPDSWSESIACGLCPLDCEYTINQTPWITGRTLTYPAPIAHIMLWWHKRKVHN